MLNRVTYTPFYDPQNGEIQRRDGSRPLVVDRDPSQRAYTPSEQTEDALKRGLLNAPGRYIVAFIYDDLSVSVYFVELERVDCPQLRVKA